MRKKWAPGFEGKDIPKCKQSIHFGFNVSSAKRTESKFGLRNYFVHLDFGFAQWSRC
jgi:hypothetical protein